MICWLKGEHHRDAGPIGLVMGVSSITATIFQVPAGLLLDRAIWKRALVALAGLLVATGCLLIVLYPNLFTVIAA